MGCGWYSLVEAVDRLSVTRIAMTGGNDNIMLKQQLDTFPVTLLRCQCHHPEHAFSFLQEQPDLFHTGFFDEFFYMGSLLRRIDIRAFEMDTQQTLSSPGIIFPHHLHCLYEFLDGIGGQRDQEPGTSSLKTIFIYGI